MLHFQDKSVNMNILKEMLFIYKIDRKLKSCPEQTSSHLPDTRKQLFCSFASGLGRHAAWGSHFQVAGRKFWVWVPLWFWIELRASVAGGPRPTACTTTPVPPLLLQFLGSDSPYEGFIPTAPLWSSTWTFFTFYLWEIEAQVNLGTLSEVTKIISR